MKRSLALFLALASVFDLSAVAQTPSAPASVNQAKPVKVAVILFQAALDQTYEGQRDYADLRKKFEPRQVQFKNLTDEIEGLTKQLQAQGATLTDSERAKRAKTIEDKKKQAQRYGEDSQNDFQREMQELYSGLASKVYDVLTSYAQQRGYTLVIDGTGNSQQAPVVLYANPSIDITKAVVDAYNAKSGIPAPPAQPAAAAPSPAAKPPAAR